MSKLFINDLYFSFQGEGYNAGRRALFVRMPKCNLACSWCDTSFDTYEKIDTDLFRELALQEQTRLAIITGGEPLLSKHTPIVVKILKELGFIVACETNGTLPHIAGIDWVTCSPKRDAGYMIHPKLKPYIAELKFVVDEKFDFRVLDIHNDIVGLRYLSPEFTNMKENLKKIEEYIVHNTQWKISLQTQKLVGFK